MNKHTYTFLFLGLLFILTLAIFLLNTEDDKAKEFTPNENSLKLINDSTITTKRADANTRSEQQTVGYDYSVEVFGLIPYLSNGTFNALKITKNEQKIKINELIEETFYKILDTVINNGDILEIENGIFISSPSFQNETRDRIIVDFHFTMEKILGTPKYKSLLESGLLEFAHSRLLHFGEGPITITVKEIGDTQFGVSIATTINSADSNQVHSINKLIQANAFEENFPELVSLLK